MINNKKTGSKLEGVNSAIEFLRDELGKEGEVIKAAKLGDGSWDIEIEVIEQSEFMKKIGKRVYDKNIYALKLDKNYNVVSYGRKAKKYESTESSNE